jgi:hypothetical protein
MTSRRAGLVGAVLAAALALLPAAGAARTPPVANDPREGIWLGADEVFVHQAQDRWSVIPAGAAVNKLAADGPIIWIATDDGVIRLDTGSRRVSRLGMEDGLPSQAVTSVAVTETYVWFATNKGVVRYRKLDRAVRVFGEADGLPHAGVRDVLVAGRLVWFATRAGLAVYDPDVDGMRSYGAAEGLAADDVAELHAVGDDVWCRTDRGLSRLRVKARAFANFGPEEIGGAELRAFVQDGERIWVGTENGLVSFEPTSDTFVPFPQQAALKGKAIAGIEPFTDYLFITTDQEVVQWHKVRRTIRRFTEEDGLIWRLADTTGVRGTAIAGGQLILLFPDGAWILDIQRDHWTWHKLDPTESTARRVSHRIWGKLNASQPYDLLAHRRSEQRYATAEGGAGVGFTTAGGRSLDATARLDYGQIDAPGIRELELHLEYLGRDSDLLREVRAGDAISYRTVEEGLEGPITLLGAHVRVASPGAQPAIQATVDEGERRGISVREFLTGPRKAVYQLAHRYILPGTERVRVDGELLVSGTDYTLVYTAGQFAFLDLERADDLSIIEIEYEYDLLPKKSLGVLSILDFLPADREVGTWARTGEARMISVDSGLYAQIDGAAPKYIDRGWVRSVYAEYRQGSRSIQVAVHDMGTETQARNIYGYDLPPAREAVAGYPDVVIDIGLATSYAVKAVSKSFYFELSIDEKSDAGKESLKLFALEVLNRAENAGENNVPGPRPVFTAARIAGAPTESLELGMRALQQTPGGVPATTGGKRPAVGLRGAGVDARYTHAVGDGQVTAYAEALGTEGIEPGGAQGIGALGRVRVTHPFIEGYASGRWESPGYQSLTTRRTLQGELRGQGDLQATVYPARWLPATVFYTRQISETEDGGKAFVQHALARLQLSRERLPATSVQVGQTVLDAPGAATTERLRLVAQTDYDLAQGPLAFLHARRIAVRALYGISDATTREAAVFARADRAEQLRLEARIAPTATESVYALFRSRQSRARLPEGAWRLGNAHWELTAGARSAIVPGLVPQLAYGAIFDDDRITSTTPVRSAKGTFAAQLSIFPGQWTPALTPVLLDTRYSLASDERTDGPWRTSWRRVHRVDNRFIYAGAGHLELELYQVVERPFAGADAHRDGHRLEVGNRILLRPSFRSPITLRVDYQELEAANDRALLADAPAYGLQRTWEGALEWLMHWTRTFTTRLKGSGSRAESRDVVTTDSATGVTRAGAFTQYRAGPELELRVLVPGSAGGLYLVERQEVYRLFGAGVGAAHGEGLEGSVGVIWTIGDALYLDGEVVYSRFACSSGPCAPVSMLTPRLLFSFRI